MLCSISIFAQTCSNSFHIVVLGSSTAAGAGASPKSNSYVNLFTQYLINSVNSGSTVTNLAIGGATTYKMQPGWYSPPTAYPVDPERNIDAALALSPDGILLNYPSNDADRDIPIAEQKSNFLRVVDKADSANVPVWITSTQPRNITEEGRANLILMRDWLQTTFTSKYIDFWTGIANADGTIVAAYNSGDGVHLNNAGHAILFERVKNSGMVTEICNIVLPVEIEKFLVERRNNGTRLEWIANGLEGETFFNIQFSKNGVDWEQAGVLHTDNQPQMSSGHFTYTHLNSGSISSVLYYRIAIKYRSGEIHYSEIKQVIFDKDSNLIYRVSAMGGKITIETFRDEKIRYFLYNYRGQIIDKGNVLGLHSLNLHTRTGIYLLKIIMNSGKSEVRKIIL
ncbi:SGNH/GDSL hydrolase family protein [Agriterribacter sp.]|uniref:SGNH/GDSL hydrolase family protein n=1 Tax=Agriterribacter sp. TaxID=2821509 RepID=UPI002B911E8C|nr:SGNH/GDSL hydrolase family protein [Agriterribacter sp.]HTN09029.1 SGNH/GDSL hydrolase family protein [Agriterribacter sp.]